MPRRSLFAEFLLQIRVGRNRIFYLFIWLILGIFIICLLFNFDDLDTEVNRELLNDQKMKVKDRLLNLTNFVWLLNNESICKQEKWKAGRYQHHIMPILIHTARSHFTQRLAIRNTWGSLSIYKHWSIRLIFLLGEGNPELNQTRVENERIVQEQQQFGDLVMGNFYDSYHNLTYKHLMGYKWIQEFCPEVEIITKSDDDVFLDIIKWLDFLSSKIQIKSETWQEPEIFCKVWRHSKVYRNSSHKWYVSYNDWSEEFYPPFCSGRAYAITMNLLRKIYQVSSEVKFNRVDDLFVTMFSIQHLKSKYNQKIYMGDISKECTENIVVFNPRRKYCQPLKAERNFKTVTVLPYNNYFVANMNCMWNLSLNEYFF